MGMKTINDLEIYREAMRLAESLWNVVSEWTQFDKNAVGSQIVRAADSIAANIAEGYGRFHYKENKKHCYYARGSLIETLCFLEKSAKRDLIPKDQARAIYHDFETLLKRLNAYIKSIGNQPSKDAENDQTI